MDAVRRWAPDGRGRLLLAALSVVLIEVARVAAGPTPGAGVSLLLVIPIAIVATEYGPRAGLAAGAAAYGLFLLWVATGQIDSIPPDGHVIRAGVFLLVGGFIGWSSANLRRSSARQRHLAEALGDMLSVHAPDGRYVYVSPAAHDLLGYRPEELVGRSAYELFHPKDIAHVRSTHDEVADGESLRSVVYRIRRADGRYIWFETVSRPIREQGELVEILCSSREVTLRETERLVRDAENADKRAQVRQVLDDRGIEPVLQPIVDIGRGEPVGYEALARFPLIPGRTPDVWFRHAADVGLGPALEMLAIERALELLDALPPDAFLSVNVSPETLQSTHGLRRLLPAADRIVVELTEHGRITDYTSFNRLVWDLRARGGRLAVDDAGAGFASLRHILDLRPEFIKLDMGLTRRIHRDPARRALATALCAFATDLGADVVAEGIETPEELQVLRELGIAYGQGYLLGAPAAAPVRAV